MMDDSTDEIVLDDFCYTDLQKKLNCVKKIIVDSNYEGDKELSINRLLQDCLQMLNNGKIALECMEKGPCTSSIIVPDLISYEKGVIASFKHCSESNVIYGNFINNVKQLLTDLFKKTSAVQILFFNIIEKVTFDLTLKGDQDLLLSVLQHIWYGAEAVYNASNKIMATNWKVYIAMSQKYSVELKKNIINDEPINFLCNEIKKKVLSFHHNDEVTLKLSTYLMSVLVKLCSSGCMLESHKMLVEFILFLNCYWLSDSQDVITIKDRLSQFVDQLVLISDEMFIKVFQLSCQDIINKNTANQKISALYIAMLLLKRLIKTPCNQQADETIDIVFQLIKCIDPVMCCYNIDIYDPLLINLASVILMSDYKLFEKVEKIVIENILNTEYWSAMFSSDLWIIIMRYLPSDMRNVQFSKLAKLYEMLVEFPCFTQCPQHIYLETLLRRHYSLLTDKNQLLNICPQLKTESLKSAIGILHVPTLTKYNCLSELVKIITKLPEQKNYEQLNGDIIYLWNCIKDEYPNNFLCALIEVTIGSEKILKTILPKINTIISGHNYEDTTEMKRCRLRLIRSILLHIPTFEENLILEIFFKYLFDQHPLVRQWTVETIVYFSSVTGNQNLVSILFKRPEIRSVITDYLKMKTNLTYNHNDIEKYFKQLSLCGKFQHNCSFNGQLNKMLDKLKTDIDCLNDIVCKTKMSADELERLKEYSSLLNNICEAMQFDIENV
ncbi:uncharacterized protein LOC112692105 [Sipha flava]|uniref:Uncharacterized protein LOC112692105 n=1 Tax=Sipha flava TaxID=143950 RepID=A0A8B8GIM4_9HEMI|nr:uncharacterized protein LOC112692105 [Sipha flava]